MSSSLPLTQVGVNRANNKVRKSVDFANIFIEIARVAFGLKTRLRKSSTDEEVEASTLEKFYPNFWAQLQITWFFTLTFIKQTITRHQSTVKGVFLTLHLLIYLTAFCTQACPEGIGTNGTHRSHARCHPYPIPQPVKVGHTTGVFTFNSFRTVGWVLLRPSWTDEWKCCETGPTAFRPYPRRSESLTASCRFHYKGGTFFPVI